MGHRRHSAPRRGSLAYLPRGRAKSMEARIRAWPKVNSDEPKLLAHAGFKAGCVQIVNIDDREKTPNHGKQLVSLGTVIVTPPVLLLGLEDIQKIQMASMQNLIFMLTIYRKTFLNYSKIKTKKVC